MFCRAKLAAMRVRKDLEEFTDTKSSAGIATTTVDYCTPDLLTLHITLHMETGIYMGASFTFVIEVPANYPFTAPRVTSTGRIWHPSVHLTTGAVRLPILEADWRPVLTIHTVVFALQLMLLEPSHEYPANEAAAAAALSTPDVFREQVRCTLRGGWFVGHEFPARLAPEPQAAKRKQVHECSDSDSELKYNLEGLCLQDQVAPVAGPRKRVRLSNGGGVGAGGGGGGGAGRMDCVPMCGIAAATC